MIFLTLLGLTAAGVIAAQVYNYFYRRERTIRETRQIMCPLGGGALPRPTALLAVGPARGRLRRRRL